MSNFTVELINTGPRYWFHKRTICSCGWVGRWRWRWSIAMNDALNHAHRYHPSDATIGWGKS